jgi:hypothetical protein
MIISRVIGKPWIVRVMTHHCDTSLVTVTIDLIAPSIMSEDANTLKVSPQSFQNQELLIEIT